MFYICLALTIGISYVLIKNPRLIGIKGEIADKRKPIVFLIIGALIFGGSVGISYLGPGTTMGSPFELSSYTEKYYVEAYDSETENLIGTYPAAIECNTYEEDYNDQTYSYREYRVDTIYTPKGEIWCDAEGVSLSDIEEGYKTTVYDSGIGPFDVRITKSKVQ